MKKRVLRFEPLEGRRLFAVWAGGEALAAAVGEAAPDGTVAVPAPTEAVPAGQRVGDVFIGSTADVDGDGFIGPAELSYMSYGWFSSRGDTHYRWASDLDGDGFVGPGDYALLSAYWFKSNEDLPESTKSYDIYPSDISNWYLFGEKVSKVSAKGGTLTIDAASGALEAVCDYGQFADDIYAAADFKGTGTAFAAGIELAVQETGARYYAEFQNGKAVLYYVDEAQTFNELRSADYTFASGQTYSVWMQVADGQVACGVDFDTLIALDDDNLSGGGVGFYAGSGTGAFSNIWVEYDPGRVENTPEPGPVTPQSNEDIVWNYLYQKIGNAYGVAGLMGNLNAESGGFRANNLQNSYERSLGMSDDEYTAAVDNGTYDNFVHDSAGYGIAQWTFWSRKQALYDFAQSQGTSIGDLNMQLDYLWYELSVKYSTLAPALKNATSVREASDVILLQFERPKDQSEAAQIRRASYGQSFYDRHVS